MDYALVNIEAAAREEVIPNTLRINFACTVTSDNSSDATTFLKTAVYDVLELIKPHVKSEEVEIETSSFRVQPRWTAATRNKSSSLIGYIGRAELVLSGTDTRTISELAGSVESMFITGTTYSVSRKFREEIETRVLGSAIQAFRDKARAIAQSFGFAKFKTVEVTVTPEYDTVQPIMMPTLSVDVNSDSTPVPVEAGKTTIGVQVTGQIQMVD